jgi:hypothetical protein
MKKFTTILLVLLSTNLLFSQKNYLSASIFGQTPVIGASYERTIMKENIGIEFGVGVLSASLGVKYYPKKITNTWTPYFGSAHYLYAIPSNAGWKTYIPLGLTHISKEGNRLSFDIGPNINWYDNRGNLNANFTVKFGYIF